MKMYQRRIGGRWRSTTRRCPSETEGQGGFRISFGPNSLPCTEPGCRLALRLAGMRESRANVIPAKAGIQCLRIWILAANFRISLAKVTEDQKASTVTPTSKQN